MGKPPLLVIAGPTASGKSALALARAQAIGGVVINADASQLYADIPILSAQPDAAEQALVPHRLYGVLDGAEAGSAADWAGLARREIRAGWASGAVPILVGGTGLYLDVLLHGIAPVPPVPADARATVRAMPAAEVRARLERADPAMAARLRPTDPQRNARALEVLWATGRSLLSWQALPPAGGVAGEAQVEATILMPDREEEARRIAARVAAMWEKGALAEVQALSARGLSRALPVMRAIGVAPLLAHLAGAIGRDEALARWQADTRRYAKRQRTFLASRFPDWERRAP